MLTLCRFRTDHADSSRRRYKKDLDLLKPDMEAYNRQKEIAMGLGPGALVKAKGKAVDDGEGSSDVRTPCVLLFIREG